MMFEECRIFILETICTFGFILSIITNILANIYVGYVYIFSKTLHEMFSTVYAVLYVATHSAASPCRIRHAQVLNIGYGLHRCLFWSKFEVVSQEVGLDYGYPCNAPPIKMPCITNWYNGSAGYRELQILNQLSPSFRSFKAYENRQTAPRHIFCHFFICMFNDCYAFT